MKIKPILFNTEMVRAILDGRKTVTRRLIKPHYRKEEGGFQVCTNVKTQERWVEKTDWDEGSFEPTRYVRSPYQPNDILYVRETWNYGHFDSSDVEYSSQTWFEPLRKRDGEYLKAISSYIYRADFTEQEEYEYGMEDEKGNLMKMPWRPSIHMPKEAARIWLKVKGVRVERLQDMKAQDSLNEGVKLSLEGIMKRGESPLKPFAQLWDSTIKREGLDRYGWDANPWVWVIEFERCEKPEGAEHEN